MKISKYSLSITVGGKSFLYIVNKASLEEITGLILKDVKKWIEVNGDHFRIDQIQAITHWETG